MTNRKNKWIGLLAGLAACLPAASGAAPRDTYLSPAALAATRDGRTLYVAAATSAQILVFDLDRLQVTRTVAVPDSPLGLALSADEGRLFVACAAPSSRVCVVNVGQGKVTDSLAAGHTAMSPVLSPDGQTLYVCSRFDNEVRFIDLKSRKTVKRIGMPREPISAALTPDGRHLLVANHLHQGRADGDEVAATVTVVDVAAGRVARDIRLPNGSGLLRDIRISPDGRHAAVVHVLARFHLPTTQVDRGWINSNALTLIDLATLERINTVLLDNVDSGAANPWGVAWSADGRQLCVTHAGTHELSVIDTAALLGKLARIASGTLTNAPGGYPSVSRTPADVPNDLAFLVGLRRRIALPVQGPRALVLTGSRAVVAGYFSDALAVVDLSAPQPRPTKIALGPELPVSVVRKGELLFNDGTMCFQGWQSCASCHSSDARVDGLNWDLLNDGIGNPKNNKSLLLAHRTGPSMSLGVRASAEAAVRAGIRHMMFTVRPEADAVALDEYLKSLKPIPSPYLDNGRLSAAAQRGKKLFFDAKTACATCHKPELFTDRQPYDVGTSSRLDRGEARFDTPTLIELWRTAPYLHDGSAATMREVLTTANRKDAHGQTSHLTSEQIDDLTVYLLSL